MIQLAVAVFFLIATPGPGVLSLAGVGAAYGFRRAMPYLVGLLVGNWLVLLLVASGLAALVFANPVLRWVLFVASLAYLVYLAARIALAGSRIAIVQADRCPGVAAGILLQTINPKAYAVNTAFITGFPLMAFGYTLEVTLKVAIITAVWLPIHLIWALAGASLKRLDPPPNIQRRINVLMAGSMLAVVAIAALA